MSDVSPAAASPELVRQAIDMVVAKKALNAAKLQGQAALSLLESAAKVQQRAAAPANPGAGAGAHPYLGRNLDVTA